VPKLNDVLSPRAGIETFLGKRIASDGLLSKTTNPPAGAWPFRVILAMPFCPPEMWFTGIDSATTCNGSITIEHAREVVFAILAVSVADTFTSTVEVAIAN